MTVEALQLLGSRNKDAKITAGIFQLLAADGMEVYNSGNVEIPLPSGDVTINVPNVGGVRRMRFTATAGQPGLAFVGVAEVKVIGSTMIHRTRRPDPNLVQLLPTSVHASSTLEVSLPASVLGDDAIYTTWYAASASAGEFIEVSFPLDVTVTGIETNNPGSTPGGFGSSLPILCHGNFQLFDADGGVLFTSNVVNTPFNDRGIGPSLFTMSVPSTSGVRRVRYNLVLCDPGNSFPLDSRNCASSGPRRH